MRSPNTLTTVELVELIQRANAAYRSPEQTPFMSDAQYDACIEELRQREPEHPFLHRVEPESDMGGQKVRHTRPMLSTAKCYEADEIRRWVGRMGVIAANIGVEESSLMVRVTPKLDGMAARFENGRMVSRGDGVTGFDITRILERGLQCIGTGDGEIVMPQQYFDDNLADTFEYPRNVVVGAVSADTVREEIKEAFQDKAIRFVSYATLPEVIVRADELADKVDAIREKLIGDYEYPVDGLVAEITDEDVKVAAGATGHHHIWMIAIKQKGETAQTTVEGIAWQNGRTGRLTPVVLVKPVSLTGCTISKVTAHHAMNVLKEGIGKGAVVEILRSGDVIPFINSIVKPAPDASNLIPTACPCCGAPTEMQKDFLICTNENCSDRKAAQIEHFFSILGNIDLFGPKTCSTLVEHGITSLVDIFTLSESDYINMGFGPGQAANLVKEIEQAKARNIDDYRLLAAFGIRHLGRGDSKKLLGHVAIDELAGVTEEFLMSIKGFGRITSQSIAASLPGILDDLAFMLAHFANIERTPMKVNAVAVDSPIAGKRLVFTGAMSKSRDEMKAECESLSGIAQGSVNKKTDYLVIGDKVGESKLSKARSLGITIITEEEYRAMLAA